MIKNYEKSILKYWKNYPQTLLEECKYEIKKNKAENRVNPIQDRGGDKRASPTSAFPVTSTNIGIRPQNFLTFSFNPFSTLV